MGVAQRAEPVGKGHDLHNAYGMLILLADHIIQFHFYDLKPPCNVEYKEYLPLSDKASW